LPSIGLLQRICDSRGLQSHTVLWNWMYPLFVKSLWRLCCFPTSAKLLLIRFMFFSSYWHLVILIGLDEGSLVHHFFKKNLLPQCFRWAFVCIQLKNILSAGGGTLTCNSCISCFMQWEIILNIEYLKLSQSVPQPWHERSPWREI
jgi:hypothetical protein